MTVYRDDGSAGTFTLLLVVMLSLLAYPTVLLSQTLPGDKTAYVTTTVGNAHDYVDASVYFTKGTTEICGTTGPIISALNDLKNTSQYNSKGVIDLRGVFPPSLGTALTCSSSNPWPGSTGSYNAVSATILFPAGTISINSTWVLPGNTRLVGVGASTLGPSGTTTGITTIQAASGFSGDIIDMGNSSICGQNGGSGGNCSGIAIEHMRLDGNSSNTGTINGISNTSAQELNYVTDVALVNITGTGLSITGEQAGGTADNSGPYSTIYFSGSGVCVSINGTYATRGLRGLNCNNSVGSTTVPAIKVDGSNNTIQDLYISGYKGDGIVIGSQGSYANNNVIVNVTSDNNTKNLVHIENTLSGQVDLTLMGIKSGANTTIQDDLTNSKLTERTVALYVVGEGLAGTTGYSRFTTSSTQPAWFVGSGKPGQSDPCTGTVLGSLYSLTSGSTGPTLWACVGTSSSSTWQSLSSN